VDGVDGVGRYDTYGVADREWNPGRGFHSGADGQTHVPGH
jgi:hypothetical protein